MKLVLASEVFSEAAMPDVRTLRKYIKDKRVPGVIVAGHIYIDTDALAEQHVTPGTARKRSKPKSNSVYRV